MKKGIKLFITVLILVVIILFIFTVFKNLKIENNNTLNTSKQINYKSINNNKNTNTNNEQVKELTIYDIEEGYLTVPFNNKADKHDYDWSKLDNSNLNNYKYEDKKYKSKLGIDVSSYQGDIDWEKVKASGVEFAILRLGYRGYGEAGRVLLDDKFEQNYENARNQGIEIGVYFFSQSINLEEVRYEAQFVLENLNEKEISYPVIFDLERINYDTARTDNLTNEEINTLTKEFCRIIKENGYTPCIYGNSKTFTTKMNLEEYNDIKKWYADYLKTPLYPYEFDIWQYTENGFIEGIEGKVDIDIEFVKK